MNTIDLGEGFRLLEPHEIILATDSYGWSDIGVWVPFRDGTAYDVGWTFEKARRELGHNYCVRRAVPVIDPGEGYRLVDNSVEDVINGDELLLGDGTWLSAFPVGVGQNPGLTFRRKIYLGLAVPKGHRLLHSDNDVVQEGDMLSFNGPDYTWIEMDHRKDLVGLTPTQVNEKHPMGRYSWIFCRKVPVFKVSDHGEGVYETRCGRHLPIVANCGYSGWEAHECPWESKHIGAWYDNGRFFEDREHPNDLIRYVGPIPKWEPTEEFRAIPQRKWVRGDEVEWRNV